MSDRVRVGVIGLGMGMFHLNNYAADPNAQVTAICDLNEERLNSIKEQKGIPFAFTDYREMLASDTIDAVSIAVPNFLHKPMAIDAMNAGKHVLCEKPMAMNTEEAQAMADVAKATGVKFMMHFNSRFFAPITFLKSYIDQGNLGEIYYAKAGWLRRRGIPFGTGWFTRKAQAGGGPLIDIGVHVLDVTLWLMGNPEVASVSGTTYSKLGTEITERMGRPFDVEDLASGFIRFKNGATLFLESSWAQNLVGKNDDKYFELYGYKGGANLKYSNPVSLRLTEDRYGAICELEPTKFNFTQETPQQHFIKSILEDKEPLATAEHGVQVMKILDAIYLSARKGEEVKIS